MKRYLPIFLDIEDKNILIVGGGNVAYQKISKILPFTSNIKVVAPDVSEKIKTTKVNIIQREFVEKDLDDIFLVYICTNNEILNEEIKKIANKKGKLVNVVDNKKLSDFISPAVLLQDDITIAVSSNGTDVKKAIKIRDKIELFLKYGNFD